MANFLMPEKSDIFVANEDIYFLSAMLGQSLKKSVDALLVETTTP